MRILIISLLLLNSVIYGQTTITIQDALNYAVKNNPELNKINEQISISSALRLNSFGLHPLQIAFMKEGMPNLPDNEFIERRQSLNQSIDFPLTSYYRYRSNSSGHDAALFQYEQTKRNIKAKVKRAYVNVIHARKMIDLSKQKLAIAKELNETAQNRLIAGEASEMEVMRTEISFAEAENDKLNAELGFDMARYALFEVIGLDTEEQRYDIVFPDSLTFVDFTIDQDKILNELEQQPGLMSREKNYAAKSFAVNQAWSSTLPDFQFSIYRQDFGTGYNFYGFEAGITIPLWFAFNQLPAIQKARAENRMAQFELARTRLAFKREIENAWHGYATSRQTLLRFQELISERSAQLLKLTLQGYRLGEIGLLALLDTQRTFIISRENYYNALRNYYYRLIDLEKHIFQEIVFTE